MTATLRVGQTGVVQIKPGSLVDAAGNETRLDLADQPPEFTVAMVDPSDTTDTSTIVSLAARADDPFTADIVALMPGAVVIGLTGDADLDIGETRELALAPAPLTVLPGEAVAGALEIIATPDVDDPGSGDQDPVEPPAGGDAPI